MTPTRRKMIAAAAAAPLAACARAPSGGAYDAIVVGAGAFGAWTAEHMRRLRKRVLLVDQMGPANARASSGGESRMTRATYGRDAIYTRMAHDSLAEWKRVSDRASLPLFHRCGVLFFFQEMVDYARQSIDVHRELGLPLEQLAPPELRARWPQIDFEGVAFGLFEPTFGALMARRGVEEVVARFVERGGTYRLAHVAPGAGANEVTLDGETARADAIVYACGPWLPKMFPALLGQRIFVTRQEVAFIAPPDGEDAFEPGRFPGWADFNGGDVYYGFPNLEARGFKLARDHHGEPFDPDSGDRRMSEAGAALLRAYAERRFPALAGRPFTEFRVCQYENSSSGDFLIDRHPTLATSYLLGAGSGHGYKHGPEVGRIMAELVVNAAVPNARFSLASKATIQAREVL